METEQLNVQPEHKPANRRNVFWLFLFLSIVGSLFVYDYTITSPLQTDSAAFVVEPGMSVQAIAKKADKENIVQSEIFLYALLTSFHDPTKIHAGQYIFTPADSIYDVADKLASSRTEDDLVTLTFPEGFTVSEFATIVDGALPNFSATEYTALTTQLEGRLFPETYFVPEWFDTVDVITLQQQTYEENVRPLLDSYQGNLTEEEVLILASIIEREANTSDSMKLVASVLLNRIEIGMPLQADASIEYVLNKPLSELTPADLKIDSPYNTYTNQGLPPTPIGNPGLTSIEAVLSPTNSDYFYYITDETGTFHFARTFDEHTSNINRYLR